jgi:starch-binding outer membrane protein, SusD/RagB family
MKIIKLYMLLCVAVLMNSCSDALDAPSGSATALSYDDIFADNTMTSAFLNTCYRNIVNFGLHTWWCQTNLPIACSDESFDTTVSFRAGMSVDIMYSGAAKTPSTTAGNLYSQNPFFAGQGKGGNNNNNFAIVGDLWTNFYQTIHDCNVFISKIDNANATQAQKNQWKAEAYVLRAYYYEELLKWFGPAPIFSQAADLVDNTYLTGSLDQFKNVVRNTPEEILDFVVASTDSALAIPDGLQWKWTSIGESVRMTKAIAYLLRSRTALFAASPLNNPTNDVALWDKACDLNKEALDQLTGAGFELFNDLSKGANDDLYKKLFKYYEGDGYSTINNSDGTACRVLGAGLTTEMAQRAAMIRYFESMAPDYNDISTAGDKETIVFSNNYNGWGATLQAGGNSFNSYDGAICTNCPSQEMVDAFEVLDKNGKAYDVLDPSKDPYDVNNSPYNEDHSVAYLNPEVVSGNIYSDDSAYIRRDPRFYAYIFFNGSIDIRSWAKSYKVDGQAYDLNQAGQMRPVYTYLNDPNAGINPSTLYPSPLQNRTRTGYYNARYCRFAQAPNRPRNARLSEVYLNYAECCAMDAKFGGTKGTSQMAIDNVNKIRNRAGMPDRDLSEAVTNKADQAVKWVRSERRVEMMFEENRYHDVRRWSYPNDDLAATDKWISKMEITRKGTDGTENSWVNATPPTSWSAFSVVRKPVTATSRLNYTNKYLRLPLLVEEANKMKIITGNDWQNQGW